MDFLDILTLEGAGRQTVDTRSTSGLFLTNFWCNASNKQCGRSVVSKLSLHKPAAFFLRTDKEISEKQNFFTLFRPLMGNDEDIVMGHKR